MPITTYSLYQDLTSYVNTYQGGFFRPQTDFLSAVNNISKDIWREKVAQAEKAQEFVDDLLPFLKGKNMKVIQQQSYYGTFKPPTGYGRFAGARILLNNDKETIPDKNIDQGKCDNVKSDLERTQEYYESLEERLVEKINSQRWTAVCTHRRKAPTFENPKITQVDEGFRVAPRTVSVVVLYYYVEPENAEFKYTISPGNIQTGSGDMMIYDPSSKPLQWAENMRNEFLVRLGERYGLFTRDGFVSQISNQQRALGN